MRRYWGVHAAVLGGSCGGIGGFMRRYWGVRLYLQVKQIDHYSNVIRNAAILVYYATLYAHILSVVTAFTVDVQFWFWD